MARVSLRIWLIAGLLAGGLMPASATEAIAQRSRAGLDAASHSDVPATRPRTLARSVPVAIPEPGLDLLAFGQQPGPRISFEFPPTHLGFSWRGSDASGFAFRTLSADGTLTPWTDVVPNPDLEGRRQFAGVYSVDRPIEVELSVHTDSGLRDLKLDYLNTLDGPRVATATRATAARASAAAVGAPRIITRAQWGADESIKRKTGSCKRRFYPLQQMFVHHTAGSNFDSHPKATMRSIYWFHVVRRGWCDVGYNFVVSWDGRIFEGRWARKYAPWEDHTSETRDGLVVSGAHVADFNSGSVGVSLMGNFTSIAPSPEMRRSLAELLAWEVDRHGLDTHKRHRYRNPQSGQTKRLRYIAGHRDAGQTSCPGNVTYNQLPSVRDDTAAVIGEGKAESLITLETAEPKVEYGQPASFSGRLTDGAGVGLAATPVAIYLKSGTAAWVESDPVITTADGSFDLAFAPERNVRVAAVYHGDETRWGAQSHNAKVKVRALVSLEAQDGTADVFGTKHYPAGTTAITFSGDVEPAHPGAIVKARVFKKAADGTYELLKLRVLTLASDSTYSFTFEVPTDSPQGEYRVVARFPKDDDHAAAVSSPVDLIIDPV